MVSCSPDAGKVPTDAAGVTPRRYISNQFYNDIADGLYVLRMIAGV